MLYLRSLLLMALLMLSSAGANAAYCLGTYANGGRIYFIQATQPANVSACAYVVITGPEFDSHQAAITKNTNQDAQIASINSQLSTLNTQQTSLATSIANLQLANSLPFDSNLAGSLFAFFFTSTVACWLVAKKAGLILSAVRKF